MNWQMTYPVWPSAVPHAAERGPWSYVPGQPALQGEIADGDVQQVRNRGITIGEMKWSRGLTSAEMPPFRAFLTAIHGGMSRFIMPVSVNGYTYEDRVVQIVEGVGGVNYARRGADTVVSFTIRVYPRSMTPV